MELIAFLAVVALVGAFVSAPLRRPRLAGLGGSPAAALEAARDAKLREIHDTALDHRTGKLSDADFERLDASLRAEAAALLRALDGAQTDGAR